MSSCAFEFAEDGGNDSVAAVADGSGYMPALPLRDDLPLASGSGRQDYRGMFPADTVYALGQEAASGNGERVFSANRGRSGGLLWFFAAAAGIYALSR